MLFKFFTLLLLLSLGSSAFAQFTTTSSSWSTPIGGYISSGVNLGYYQTSGSPSSTLNSETWEMIDMNGDQKPDLVVTSAGVGGSGGPVQFGAGTNPFWKVYLNTGSGISTSVINWTTPIGGTVSSGYYRAFGPPSSTLNSETWSLTDMNGDHQPDLVVTSAGVGGSGGPVQFGAGTNPYWKIYFNNGSGFSTTVINWNTPIGGSTSSGNSLGYYQTVGNPSSTLNSETWSLTDMNGDQQPDLIITSVGVGGSGGPSQFGAGTNPYWKLYLNNGNGFSSASNWSTPIGGYISSGNNLGYYQAYGPSSSTLNSETWSLTDMNGDQKPDLLITSAGIGGSGGPVQFGAGTNPYWKVYLNTGSSFSASFVNWTTPIGGFISSSTNVGYTDAYGSASSTMNSETWSLTDIDHDFKPDLIVTSAGVGGSSGPVQFGAGTNPYWKVYMNTGFGISTSVINWTTPIGGYISSGNNLGYFQAFGSSGSTLNSETWSLTDMDGDQKPDLLITSAGIGGSGGPMQFGAGTNPYWKVFTNLSITAVPEIENDELTVSPNPVTTSFTITSKKELTGSHYKVINSTGQIIKKGSITNKKEMISLEGQPSGLYILKINNSSITILKN
ncbi:MAG: T9SS type A sorting domain-containing protein [Bacteroidetes bacterium]|nr:T9SS type A sorting domain-containing protein [Bacteroidota bacterium]